MVRDTQHSAQTLHGAQREESLGSVCLVLFTNLIPLDLDLSLDKGCRHTGGPLRVPRVDENVVDGVGNEDVVECHTSLLDERRAVRCRYY